MGFAVEDRPLRPLTADEVLRMVELGILDEDEPVELLGGALVAMSPKSAEHETIKHRLIAWLMSSDAAASRLVRVEAPLVVPDRTSLPEPDVAVVEAGDYTRRHPTSALLVIEVAVSSLQTDTVIKPSLYAGADVPELWVVDVPMCRIRLFSQPRTGEAGFAGYATERVVAAPAALRPSHVDVAPLELAGLFAGL